MSNSPKTPERVLMEAIDSSEIELRGATPAMLVSVLRSAGFIAEMRPSSTVDPAPDDSKAIHAVDKAIAQHGYTLEHAEHPNQVGQWDPDEAAAYRDNGGFQEGRDAVQAVRRAKLGSSLRGVVVDAQAAVLRRAARQLEEESAALSETSAGMIGSKDYGADDIIRYGAYASGAASAAHTLRKQADELAGACPECTGGEVFSDARRIFVSCETCS